MNALMTAPRKNGRTDRDQLEIDLELGLPKLRQILTPKETADYLHCDVDHVYHLVDEGELLAENHALKTEGVTPKGRTRQRYLRIIRQSVIDFRARRRIAQ